MTAPYQILVNHKVVKEFGSNEYQEALEEAAQLDYVYNSPELNDGVEGNTTVELVMKTIS